MLLPRVAWCFQGLNSMYILKTWVKNVKNVRMTMTAYVPEMRHIFTLFSSDEPLTAKAE